MSENETSTGARLAASILTVVGIALVVAAIAISVGAGQAAESTKSDRDGVVKEETYRPWAWGMGAAGVVFFLGSWAVDRRGRDEAERPDRPYAK